MYVFNVVLGILYVNIVPFINKPRFNKLLTACVDQLCQFCFFSFPVAHHFVHSKNTEKIESIKR